MNLLSVNKIYHGDCLEVMKGIKDHSIDMVLCDLPYGTTQCKWDSVIPFDALWANYKRIIKKNGVIALTASQPFTSVLVVSNIDWFKYEWIWQKNAGSNFSMLKFQPMKEHESVLIFAGGGSLYKPIMQPRAPSGLERQKTPVKFNTGSKDGVYGEFHSVITKKITVDRYPSSVQKFNRERGLHPTQKPVALFEYLIKTYTNEGDLVLDNCAGSGTTGVACKNLGRNFILIEKERRYCEIAYNRIFGLRKKTLKVK